MKLKLLNFFYTSNAPREGENSVSLTASVYSFQESCDSHSIELSEDDAKEVVNMKFAYDNLFEKFFDLPNLNKKVFRRLKEIGFEKRLFAC